MKISYALRLAADKLKNITTSILDARLLLASSLSYSTEELLLNYELELDKNAINKFFALIERRKKYEPIAYIIGKKEFYGIDFIVNSNVLIPRPETELIIDLIKADTKSQLLDRNIDILELGTGSGAISVSLAKELSIVNITAVDICSNALKVAWKNIKLHNLAEKIKLVQSNWYSALDNSKRYDYIVSNPPYICYSELSQMSKETKYFEPGLSLYANNGGLLSYQEIIRQAKFFLKTNGKVILEIGHSQARKVTEILKNESIKNIDIKKDLSRLDRIIIASY